MNKTIATIAIAGAALLSPVAGMSITPVREALLGLAPEEQITTLADKIDEGRVANEGTDAKVAALEAELASAKQKNTELENAVGNQKTIQDAKIAEQAVAIEENKKTADCAIQYSSAKFCQTEGYRNSTEFSVVKKEIRDFFSDTDEAARISEAIERFNKCEDIRTQCK